MLWTRAIREETLTHPNASTGGDADMVPFLCVLLDKTVFVVIFMTKEENIVKQKCLLLDHVTTHSVDCGKQEQEKK